MNKILKVGIYIDLKMNNLNDFWKEIYIYSINNTKFCCER